MFAKRRIAIALIIGFAANGIASRAEAQDFRVYTKVSDMQVAGPDGTHPIIGRSLTLFHAGKTYDYLKAAGEVIIFDPANHQFIVLNTPRSMATAVDFDVVRVMLKERTTQMENLINELEVSRAKNAELIKNALRSQMSPNFKPSLTKNGTRLQLTSPYCRYLVDCVEVGRPSIVKSYLHYADWTARLNFLLNPNAMFPEPRLELNKSLRKLDRLPTAVELMARDEQTMHLRAEHKIGWELESHDRMLINSWEMMLKDRRTQFKTFREYQERQLTALK